MKAICIDDNFSNIINFSLSKFIKNLPKEGEEYEVTFRNTKLGEGVVLADIDCGTLPNGKPVCFAIKRFVFLGGPNEQKINELVKIENQN